MVVVVAGSRLTGVVAVHDSGVVEDDIDTAPLVELVDTALDVLLVGDIAAGRVDFAGHVGGHLHDLLEGLGQGGLGNVTHQHARAFAKEEDGGLETDAAVQGLASVQEGLLDSKFGPSLLHEVAKRTQRHQ